MCIHSFSWVYSCVIKLSEEKLQTENRPKKKTLITQLRNSQNYENPKIADPKKLFMYSSRRVFFFFFVVNFHIVATKNKTQCKLCKCVLRTVFLSTLYFEGEKPHVAIFRHRVPTDHQNWAGILTKSTLLYDLYPNSRCGSFLWAGRE